MLNKLVAAPIVLGLVGTAKVNAGPLAYGLCQAGCNAAAVACYSSTGVLFLPAVVGCNAAFGSLYCGWHGTDAIAGPDSIARAPDW